jgi:hypothetical protein
LGGISQITTGQPTVRSAIRIRAYNYARVPADILRPARDKLRVLFEKAGVEILWPEPTPGESANDAGTADCPRPFSIQVMIRARQAAWQPGRKRVMGLRSAATTHSQSSRFSMTR